MINYQTRWPFKPRFVLYSVTLIAYRVKWWFTSYIIITLQTGYCRRYALRISDFYYHMYYMHSTSCENTCMLYDKIEVIVEQDRQVSVIDNQVSSMRFLQIQLSKLWSTLQIRWSRRWLIITVHAYRASFPISTLKIKNIMLIVWVFLIN